MPAPPCQVATTALMPEKTSRVTMALLEALPCPWLAYQDTIVWVTSCGFHGPPNVQMVSGWTGSVTSARTGMLVVCMINTASWLLDDDEQLAVMAAQDGTAARLATGLGVDEGLDEAAGDWPRDAVGVASALGDGVGLGCAAEPPGPQPPSASTAATATTPSLTCC
jgi:hypothetical protein